MSNKCIIDTKSLTGFKMKDEFIATLERRIEAARATLKKFEGSSPSELSLLVFDDPKLEILVDATTIIEIGEPLLEAAREAKSIEIFHEVFLALAMEILAEVSDGASGILANARVRSSSKNLRAIYALLEDLRG